MNRIIKKTVKQKKGEFKIYSFDLDENLLFAGEVIFMWDKKKHKEIAVEQDIYYKLLQDPKRYEHVKGNIENSMRNFRKNNGYLKKQLLEVYDRWINNDEEAVWPSWKAFINAIEEEAPVSIITARGHAIKEFQSAFKAIIERLYLDGFISKNYGLKHLTFYPVSNKALNDKLGIPFEAHAAEKKSILFKKFLSETLEKYKNKIKNYEKVTIWFSDDSRGNILKMVQYVLENNTKNVDGIEIEYVFFDTGERQSQVIRFTWKAL